MLAQALEKSSTHEELSSPQGAGKSFNDFEQIGEFLVDEDSNGELASRQMSSEVREWLDHVSSETVEGGVDSKVNTKRGFLFKKKNIFTIRRKEDQVETVSKHTFNEFKRFHDALKDRYPGALIPPLPKTKSSKTDKIVDGLDYFVQEIVKNPVFRKDDSFLEFTKEKKFSNKCVKELDKTSQGIQHWREMLDVVPLPKDSFEFVHEISQELSSLISMYHRLKDYVKKLQAVFQRQAHDQRQISEMYTKWMHKEAEYKHLFGRAKDPTGGWNIEGHAVNITTMLGSMKTASDERAHCFEDESNQILKITLKTLRFELAYLSQLENMVGELRNIVKKHKSAMNELNTLKKKTTDEPEAKGNKKKQEKLVALQATTKNNQTELKTLLRGVIFESERYTFDRTARTAKMLHELMKVEDAHLKRIVEMCTRVLEALPESAPAVSHYAAVTHFIEQITGVQVAQEAPLLEQQQQQQQPITVDVVTPPNPKRESLRVAYNFVAEEQGEISLQEGQVVEVLNSKDCDDGWCHVRTEDGQNGLAPLSYLHDEEENEDQNGQDTDIESDYVEDDDQQNFDDEEMPKIDYKSSNGGDESSSPNPFEKKKPVSLLSSIQNFSKTELQQSTA